MLSCGLKREGDNVRLKRIIWCSRMGDLNGCPDGEVRLVRMCERSEKLHREKIEKRRRKEIKERIDYLQWTDKAFIKWRKEALCLYFEYGYYHNEVNVKDAAMFTFYDYVRDRTFDAPVYYNEKPRYCRKRYRKRFCRKWYWK